MTSSRNWYANLTMHTVEQNVFCFQRSKFTKSRIIPG